MSDQTKIPAPYDWHHASQYVPRDGEIVIIRGLSPPWAKLKAGSWVAVDRCGNEGPLQWKPYWWRREFVPESPEVAINDH